MLLTIYNGFVLRDYTNLESRHHQLLIVIILVLFCCFLLQSYAFISIRKTFSSFFFKEIIFSVTFFGKILYREHSQTQYGVFANLTCVFPKVHVLILQTSRVDFADISCAVSKPHVIFWQIPLLVKYNYLTL